MSEVNAIAARPAAPTPPAAQPQHSALASLLTQPRPALAKALAKAIQSCSAVVKADVNQHHKYAYASADTIIEEGRKALAAAGLVLLPVEAALCGSEREGPDRFELVRTFVLLHDSGEAAPLRVVWPVVPQTGRPLDKATAAADTLSLSYLLRDLLLMPRVDPSDDVSGRDDRTPQPKAQPAAAPQQSDRRRILDPLLARAGVKWAEVRERVGAVRGTKPEGLTEEQFRAAVAWLKDAKPAPAG